MRFCSLWRMLYVMCLMMAAITKDAAEVLTQDPPELIVETTTVPTAVFAGGDTETTTTPYAEAETTTTPNAEAETTTTPNAEAETTTTTTTTPYADTETTTVMSVITADEPSSTTTNATVVTRTPQDGRRSEDELRERIVRLTDELNRAIAALMIAQNREEHLAALENERYGYLQKSELKLMLLVENAQNAKVELADDTYRERHIEQRFSVNRMKDTSSRRLQVIRRLLFGAKVGLAHMGGAKVLNA